MLTTYRRDGVPVATPVSIAVAGDHAFVRSYDSAWKVRRIRNNPEVEVGPSTARGKPTGPALPMRARRLQGDEARQAARWLARKYPGLQGVAVPFFHRAFRTRAGRTVHFELTPRDGGSGWLARVDEAPWFAHGERA